MSTNHSIAIIGAGPAGLYAAAKLAEQNYTIVLLNRDIKPGGLAEYGIYYDKYKMKDGLRQQFTKILSHPNIHYYGNITVGTHADFSLDTLSQLGFSAILVCVGAQGTKWLGLAGEFLAGVYHAKELVYHYNKLPPYSQISYDIGKRVALIGMGNVMVDVARWLIHHHKVEEVTAYARRGPAEVKFTKKEMETVACNLDFKALDAEFERAAPIMQAVGQNMQEAKEYILSTLPTTCPPDSSTRFAIRFFSSPSAILDDGNGQVCGLEIDETTLLKRDDGSIAAKPSGKKIIENVDTVIFCIGDRVDESLGLPVKRGEYVLNDNPRFAIQGISYEAVYDNFQNIFVAGWARKASDGLVGIARKDGENAAQAVMMYLNSLEAASCIQSPVVQLEGRIKALGKPIISLPQLEKLKNAENEIKDEFHLPFFSFPTNSEMFAAMGIFEKPQARLIQLHEVDEWTKLRHELWPSNAWEKNIQEVERIKSGDNDYYIMVMPKPEGGLQGFLEFSLRPYAESCSDKPLVYLEGLYVIPESRQKGIAKALFAAVENWAKSHSYDQIATDAEMDNLASQYILKRLGFSEVNRLIHFCKNI